MLISITRVNVPLLPLLLLTLLASSIPAMSIAKSGDFDHTHQIFTELLVENVRDGKVNYPGFIEAQSRFDTYLQSFASVGPESLADWSRAEQIAFWINAYNAFTIKAIIDNYPIKPSPLAGLFHPDNSIRQIAGVWDRLRFDAAGKKLTLDQIEHEILRVDYEEPRVHFALVCASISCPDLRVEAYRPAALEHQLESQTRNFLADESKGVQRDGDEIHISQIFKWFPEDFAGSASRDAFDDYSRSEAGVLGFILAHAPDAPVKSLLQSGEFELQYLGYDWSLNE